MYVGDKIVPLFFICPEIYTLFIALTVPLFVIFPFDIILKKFCVVVVLHIYPLFTKFVTYNPVGVPVLLSEIIVPSLIISQVIVVFPVYVFQLATFVIPFVVILSTVIGQYSIDPLCVSTFLAVIVHPPVSSPLEEFTFSIFTCKFHEGILTSHPIFTVSQFPTPLIDSTIPGHFTHHISTIFVPSKPNVYPFVKIQS
jgi:hypothetical protein